MRVAMIGTGYVGLVSGACFADFGHHITCIDTDSGKIDALRRGEMPIFEPGLADLVAWNVNERRLRFSTDLPETVRKADAVFIAVGTPLAPRRRPCGPLLRLCGRPRHRRGSGRLHGCGDEIDRSGRDRRRGRPHYSRDAPVGQIRCRIQSGIFARRRRDPRFQASRPHRGRNRRSACARNNDRPLYLNSAPILYTQRRTAELIKYAGNAFLATKITFINEIADLCERVGADVQEVARGIGLDNRIGPKFLNAGPGYGGSCFPKDTLALPKTAHDYDVPLRIIEAVVAVNDTRKRAMARKVAAALGGHVRGKTVAVLGLTFKPNTDDMRDAPSIALITALQDMGAIVRAYDPTGSTQAKALFENVAYCDSPYAAAEDAHAIVIVTEWEQLRALDLVRLKTSMASPVMIDLRNIYRPEEMARQGFVYESVGRPPVDGLDVELAPARPHKYPSLVSG